MPRAGLASRRRRASGRSPAVIGWPGGPRPERPRRPAGRSARPAAASRRAVAAGLPVARHRRAGRGRPRAPGGHGLHALARIRGARTARGGGVRARRAQAGASRQADGRCGSRRAPRRPPARGRRAPRSGARRGVASGRAGAAHRRACAADRLARRRRRARGARSRHRAEHAAHRRRAGRCAGSRGARCGGAARRRPGAGARRARDRRRGAVAARPVVRARPDRAGREPVPPGCRRDRGSRGRRMVVGGEPAAPARGSRAPRPRSGQAGSVAHVASRSARRRRSPSPTRSTACRRGSRRSSRSSRPPARIVERRSEGSVRRTIVPDLLTATEAGAWASAASAAAIREGVGTHAALPDRVALASLVQPATPAGSRATLRVAVGVTAEGVLELDLVGRGPHAIVAGTTGSGKSEFLLAWLTAMARCHPPDRVSFLLVDFKGGAAFEPIRDLPHVTGIVTDLDEAEAERAMLSLRSELRHRESVLAEAGVRDVAQLPPRAELARLVLVVDEFQAMIERFPELGVVVADIAARGRSLGVHLVLASQRPNGVVREQVSANCAIRVSLRVMQRADSLAVVGSDAAAAIGPETPGRGVVDPGDGRPIPFQSAWVEPVADRGPPPLDGGAPACPSPLGGSPARSAHARRPRRRRRARARSRRAPSSSGWPTSPSASVTSVAVWTPAADGHLLVVGGPGSGRIHADVRGRSAAGAAAGVGRVIRIAGTAARRWDDLSRRDRRDPDRGRPGARASSTTSTSLPRLARRPSARRLRHGRGASCARGGVAASPSPRRRDRRTDWVPAIRELFGQTVVLRHPSRSDLVQAGERARLWRADDPPGSGQWRGRRVQFVDAGPSLPRRSRGDDRASSSPSTRRGLSAIVTASPRTDAAAPPRRSGTSRVLEPIADAAVRAAIAARDRAPATASAGRDRGRRCLDGELGARRRRCARTPWSSCTADRASTASWCATRPCRRSSTIRSPSAGCCAPGERPRRSPWPHAANN